MRWVLTTLGLWLAVSACGGIAIVDDAGIGGEVSDGDGTSGVGGAGALDCTNVSFDMSFPARECTTVDTCDITGRAPARVARDLLRRRGLPSLSRRRPNLRVSR